MAFLLGRGSALEWIRRQPTAEPLARRYSLRIGDLESNYRRLLRHEELISTLSSPVHLTMGLRNNRRHAKAIRCHLMALPEAAYPCYKVERAVFCSAPELLMLQMGTVLDEDELLFLGYELCGCYRFDGEGHLVQRAAICDPSAMSAFADTCPGVHGRKRVARVLPRIIEGAASPMEAALAICLTEPLERGGLGLPQPVLNEGLPVEGDARRLWDRDVIHPDLLWRLPIAPGKPRGVVIEYDSDDHHTGGVRIARDARRRNVLETMGYRVLTMTNEQFASMRELERVGMMVARELGTPLEEATDEAWVAREAFHQRIRGIGLHPERLLGA